jgi:hypothetical protein
MVLTDLPWVLAIGNGEFIDRCARVTGYGPPVLGLTLHARSLSWQCIVRIVRRFSHNLTLITSRIIVPDDYEDGGFLSALRAKTPVRPSATRDNLA